MAVAACALAALVPAVARAQAPSDACAAAPLVSVPGVYTGTTVTATNDGSAGCGMSSTTRDLWLKVMPAANAALVASTCGGATWDTVLSVHTGCPGSSANQVGCLDDSCGQQTQLSVTVSAGQTYYVRIAGFNGGTGAFTISLSYTDPPPPPNPGPDVIVGDLTSITRWGAVGGITAYSVGTTSCNIGTTDVLWVQVTNQHPLIAQAMYRLKNGRFEQLGQSWLKHTFGTIDNGICGPCNGHLGQVLGVGCSDPYSSSQAGMVTLLGPKWEVNVTTGNYPYPFYNSPAAPATIGRRIQAATVDIDPAQNSGALYFFECAYITGDDALAGNGLNNYSHRRITIASATSTPVNAATVQRMRPAIKAWKDNDPAVTEVNADYVESGLTARFIVSARATDSGNGTWNYEYAVFNLNANRSGRAFAVPVRPCIAVTGMGFHDVAYHSGDGTNGIAFDGTDWTPTVSGGQVSWAAATFLQDPSANALRWGTLYNFRFTASAAPRTGNASIELFKPGAAGDPNTVAVTGVPVPGCPADFDCDGQFTPADVAVFVSTWAADLQNGTAPPAPSDFDGNGVVQPADVAAFVTAWFNALTNGC